MPVLAKFFLIFARVSSFFFTVPVFSYRTVPAPVKIGISFCLSYIAYFAVMAEPVQFNETYVLLLLKEIVIGLALGLLASIMFSAVQVAGGFIDFQMGFSIANVIDPQTGAQTPIMGQYLYIFAILFLLATDGHHLLIDGIYYSFRFIRPDQFVNPFSDENVAELAVKSFAVMFGIALQISVPIVASLFLVDVALGILARTVPQLNVFVVGLPLKILSSFTILFLVIGVMIFMVKELFEILLYSLRDYLRIIGGI
jgi:flagellar biosynthetic protein FliR